MQIAHEILSNTKAKKCLKLSLVAIVRSIRTEWDLTAEEIAHILHLNEKTVRTWFARTGRPEVSSLRDQDTQILLDFIDVYEASSHLFETRVEQREWLRTATADLGDVSPLDYMTGDRMSVAALKARFQDSLH